MSVVANDMKLKLSVFTAAGNTTASTPAASLGDQVSTTELTSAQIGNLFDDVTGAQAASGETTYRCVFWHNSHATDTAFNVETLVQSQVAGGAAIDLGLDPAGVTPVDSSSQQATDISDETITPFGVTFPGGTLSIGTMGPGTVAGVWVRRIVNPATGSLSTDGATLRVTGEG